MHSVSSLHLCHPWNLCIWHRCSAIPFDDFFLYLFVYLPLLLDFFWGRNYIFLISAPAQRISQNLVQRRYLIFKCVWGWIEFVDKVNLTGWKRNGRRKVEMISDSSRLGNLIIIQNRLLLTFNTDRNFPDAWARFCGFLRKKERNKQKVPSSPLER